MSMTTEILPLNQVAEFIERVIAIQDPARAKARVQARLDSMKKQRDKILAAATKDAFERRHGYGKLVGDLEELVRVEMARERGIETPSTLPEGMSLKDYRAAVNAWYRGTAAAVKAGGLLPGVYLHTLRGLTDLNRPISEARVELYEHDMRNGKWYDSPDPVVVTEDGLIVNGQHRLIAATRVEWLDDPSSILDYPKHHMNTGRWPSVQPAPGPSFVVVLGADRKTALLMDEATRTTKDRRTIALAYARVAA